MPADLGSPDAPPKRPERVYYGMRALGRDKPPAEFQIAGIRYTLDRTVKHDFFAATAFYRCDDGTFAVLKIGRTADALGFSTQWLGQWLCSREVRFYKQLADVSAVPKYLGRVGPTGFAHVFVPGGPLNKHTPVPDGFFDELFAIFRKLHDRGIAYADTNKPQNILLGDDGKPHLIDFQISFSRDAFPFPLRWLSRMVFDKISAEDDYHLLKHKRRLRPDELTAAEQNRGERKSWIIRAHRFITRPYFRVRRQTMSRLRGAGRLTAEGSK